MRAGLVFRTKKGFMREKEGLLKGEGFGIIGICKIILSGGFPSPRRKWTDHTHAQS